MERFVVEDVDVLEKMEKQHCDSVNRVFRWIFMNVMPVLVLALIIDITFMFAVPIEVAKSEWYWIKDPVSIIISFILVRVFYSLKDLFQPHNH